MARPRVLQILTPLLLFLCALAPGACTCAPEPPRAPGVIACRPQHALAAPALPRASGAKTVVAGTIPGSFSITAAGHARYEMPISTVPGRAGGAGVEPHLSIAYESSTGDGILGTDFSLSGLPPAVTRCPSDLTDGEIRDVRFDAQDKLCLGGRLVAVGRQPGIIEFRTIPDTFVKVIGHYAPAGDIPAHEADALWFEAFMPSGVIIEYGSNPGSKPLARGGVPRAWLPAKVRDGRGNTQSYGYCFANASEYTAEYALDEIQYGGFDNPAIAPARSVRFIYGTKDPADVRMPYAGGMALQTSLRLDQIQLVGPGNELVRSYDFTYELSATTNRTLLKSVSECGSVCKPPTTFQYKSSPAGFKRLETGIPAPVSRRASPMLLDTTADGLPELIVPDVDEALSSPGNPITRWLVARNQGSSASGGYLAPPVLGLSQDWVTADPSGPSDPQELQPELGTALDFDDDGRTDILLHDVFGTRQRWFVLLARPDQSFEIRDTGISRPFPLGVSPAPPTLTSAGGSMHLADLDGSVPDLIQCEDHGITPNGDPSKPVWKVHLWKPAQGTTPAGFDPVGEPIEPLARFVCNIDLPVVDINADGKVDLIVPMMLTGSDGTQIPTMTYSALTRLSDGSWEVFDTKLPLAGPGGRTIFLDMNGDKLPDCVQSGFTDGALRAFVNTGKTFVAMPYPILGNSGFGDQDTYFRFAAALDYNGDGRQDLLMPIPATMLKSGTLPAWAVLQAIAGTPEKATFTVVDPGIPFEANLWEAITLADPRAPRIADMNGDGAADILLSLGGAFHIFENQAADQDVLVAVSDGMNAHDPEDPGFVPNVSISYGHMTDEWITNGASAGDPKLESYLYLSHADAANGCTYPRRCAVGSRRVVSGYAVNNGADKPRRFAVRYRDGRYDRLERRFLGFAKRIVTDLDTGAATADFYDNITYDDTLKRFPFAGQVHAQWRWSPGLPSQPNPDQIELSLVDVTRTLVPTNGGATYFTLPTEQRIRRMQGVYPPPGNPAQTVEAYVAQVESSGGATILRDSTAKVTDFDDFGNVLAEEMSTAGVDLTLNVERTFKNDTTRWILGQLQTQKACSTAATQSQCRLLSRTTTIYGEVETESIESGELDSLGRPIRWWWHGPDTGDTPRLMQEIAFDARGEFVARRSVPVSEGTPTNQLLFDRYEYDAAGRQVRHTTPWNAVTQTSYAGLFLWVVDPLSHLTVVEQDPLGRPVVVTDASTGITKYTYGPFGALYTVTAPGNAVTRTTRDALGRVKQLDDPDRGTTFSTHNGFGELLTSTDALGRMVTFDYDPLGRTKSRVDQHGVEILTTTWAWDTATNGIGKLHTLESPDGRKTYSYNPLGQLETLALAIDGQTNPLQATLGYDGFGRVHTITYPTPAGASPFVVAQDYDAYGHVLGVRDSATNLPYWQLTEVDNAGRFQKEAFGNNVTTKRSYFPDKQALKSIVTEHSGATVQNLSYDYNVLGNLKSRTDALQPQNKTERFRYDPLERLTCAYFSPTESVSIPCATSYDYAPNGNLITKSDIGGTLSYTDPLHPHAVTGAASDSFSYDAVGNQITRPGATLTYTPFDLPKVITQATGTRDGSSPALICSSASRWARSSGALRAWCRAA